MRPQPQLSGRQCYGDRVAAGSRARGDLGTGTILVGGLWFSVLRYVGDPGEGAWVGRLWSLQMSLLGELEGPVGLCFTPPAASNKEHLSRSPGASPLMQAEWQGEGQHNDRGKGYHGEREPPISQ